MLDTLGRDDEVKRRRLERELLNYYYDTRDHMGEVVSVEEPFSIPDVEIIIEGRTDLIIRTREGEMELVDFKAREHRGFERMDLEYQLRTYEYALRDRYSFDRLSAYAIRDSKKVSFDSDPEFRVKDGITETVERIREECFEPRKNPFCSRCVFRRFCGVGD